MSLEALSGQIVAAVGQSDAQDKSIILAKLAVAESSWEGQEAFVLLRITVHTLALSIGDFVEVKGDGLALEAGFLCIGEEALSIIDEELYRPGPVRRDLLVFRAVGECRAAVNYRGTISRRLGPNLFELDNARRLLCTSNLQMGCEYTFYNLGIFNTEDSRSNKTDTLIYCPSYSSGAPADDSFGSPLEYLYLHRKKSFIHKLLTSANVAASEEAILALMKPIIAVTRRASTREGGGSMHDPSQLFYAHSLGGSCASCECVFFNMPLLTVAGLLQRSGAVAGIALGHLAACPMTGRVRLVDSTGSIYLGNPTEQVAPHIDTIVLAEGIFVACDDLLPGATLKYLHVSSMTRLTEPVEGTGPSQEVSQMILDLFIIKSMTQPQLLTKAGPMTVALQLYKFGRLALSRPTDASVEWTGKIEMHTQRSVDRDVPAADVITKRLASGVLIGSLESDPSSIRRLSFEAARLLSAKQIALHSFATHTVSLACSDEAGSYLAESMRLLRPEPIAPVEVLEVAMREQKFVTLIKALVIKRELLTGDKVGLPKLSPLREHLEMYQQFMIGLPTNKYLVLTIQHGGHEARVIFAPNHHLLYPCGLLPGATIMLSCLKVIQAQGGRALLATSQTGVEMVQVATASPVSAAAQPCFLHELSSLPPLEGRRLAITGQFISLEGHLQEEERRPRTLSSASGDFALMGTFSDGTAVCELVVAKQEAPTALTISTIDATKDYVLHCQLVAEKAGVRSRRRRLRLLLLDLCPVNYQEASSRLLRALDS